MKIYEKPWKSIQIYENICKTMKIIKNQWKSMKINEVHEHVWDIFVLKQKRT